MILHSDREGNYSIRKLRCHCIQIMHSDIYSVCTYLNFCDNMWIHHPKSKWFIIQIGRILWLTLYVSQVNLDTILTSYTLSYFNVWHCSFGQSFTASLHTGMPKWKILWMATAYFSITNYVNKKKGGGGIITWQRYTYSSTYTHFGSLNNVTTFSQFYDPSLPQCPWTS